MIGNRKALNQYGNVMTSVEEASPHRLVQMLMQGVLDKISSARGYLERKEHGPKGQAIGSAMSIVSALRSSLDLNSGGEIAANLNDLYAYVHNRLVDANVNNDLSALDEVRSLISEIKSAWDAMPVEVKNAPRQKLAGQAAAVAR
jgi:flagellar protein FliS